MGVHESKYITKNINKQKLERRALVYNGTLTDTEGGRLTGENCHFKPSE